VTHTDPFQNFIDVGPKRLDPLFLPKSVALIGAKDDIGSVGRTLMVNLKEGHFGGKIYPVNPKRQEVLGLKAYPTIGEVPERVDLAVIVTPAATVPGIVEACVNARCRSAIVISAGFKELGAPGLQLEQQMIKVARSAEMPIIGPNCLGVMNPVYGMNATFARGMALPGNIAFISQSGAMCTAVLDWSFQEKIGFSSFVSIGSMADVNWGDLIHYLGHDPQTHSLLIYMETIGDPRSFLSAAREIAMEKPIIVIKAGRSAEAAQAAASHTGSLAGSDEVFDAALERVGVLRVDTIAELFQMASVLARQPKPKGPRLTIVTNAGGPAVLATDATVAHGAELTHLHAATIDALNTSLPAAWSHRNPVDILGDAGPERYAETVKKVMQDSATDGVLVILSPQDMTDPLASAQALNISFDKPILASWMGGETVWPGIEALNTLQIPTFAYPDDAAKTFATMWRYSHNLRLLYDVPQGSSEWVPQEEIQKVDTLLRQVHHEGRMLLTEFESKEILKAYGIPVVVTEVAQNIEEAVQKAHTIGYPVVLKLHSKTITHKTDVGGVKLNLHTEADVKKAFSAIQKGVPANDFEGVTVQKMVKHTGFELIFGSSLDSQLGPVLLFGWGGQLVEVFKDRALGLPPLNAHLARSLMQKTKIYTALKGVRGQKGVDLPYLEQLLVRFSQLIVNHPLLAECDINPLLVNDTEMLALDARFVLRNHEQMAIPLAIRPYPRQYVHTFVLRDGLPIITRPIVPEDEPLLVAFHKELSEHSVRQRFFGFMSLSERIAHERLVRICFSDYAQEIALVAEQQDPHALIGVVRLSRIAGTEEAKMTMIIADAYHGLGLGTHFLDQIIHIARVEGIQSIHATILRENHGMIALLDKKGFTMTPKEVLVQAFLHLG